MRKKSENNGTGEIGLVIRNPDGYHDGHTFPYTI